MLSISEISKIVSDMADEYDIKRIMLFGSYAEGRNTPDSDIDLLVEFNTDAVSLLTLNSLRYRLEEFLKVDVDIIHGPLEEGALIVPERLVEIYVA